VYLTEIEKYRKDGSTDEWYISKLIDRSILALDPGSLFTEIGLVVEHTLNEKESDVFLNHCQYIMKLARRINTTEMPEQLTQNISVFKAKVTELDVVSHGEVRDLYAWYRIKT
jgi:hypothetical protein